MLSLGCAKLHTARDKNDESLRRDSNDIYVHSSWGLEALGMSIREGWWKLN